MTVIENIVVIHRPEDVERAKWLELGYRNTKQDFQYLAAVDGHNDTALRPYKSMIADQFWGTNIVKPGALGCFFAHYNAWEMAASHSAPTLIAEDDSRPNAAITIPSCEADLYFVNDRVARWATFDCQSVEDITVRGSYVIEDEPNRAPGADGYIVTPKGAAMLVALAQKFGTICGVDWFLIAMASTIAPSQIREMNSIYDMIGRQFAHINAAVALPAQMENNGEFASTIHHKSEIEIEALKQALS